MASESINKNHPFVFTSIYKRNRSKEKNKHRIVCYFYCRYDWPVWIASFFLFIAADIFEKCLFAVSTISISTSIYGCHSRVKVCTELSPRSSWPEIYSIRLPPAESWFSPATRQYLATPLNASVMLVSMLSLILRRLNMYTQARNFLVTCL